jgi:copper homeostasis protein
MNQPVLLEVCANSVTSAVAAQAGGAARVELCDNLPEGGTTPSYGSILVARKKLDIKLYVLIRPRGGDFLYSDLEFEVMLADVQFCVEAGCDGIVIGILNPDGTINKERCKQLIAPAKQAGLGVTFHRAIDMCADMFNALEDIIELGCERVLTSGGKATAAYGADIITDLVRKTAGRISVMPGSGINENNVAGIVQVTGATEIHASARSLVPSEMTYLNENITMGGKTANEYVVDITDASRVKQILAAANGRSFTI